MNSTLEHEAGDSPRVVSPRRRDIWALAVGLATVLAAPAASAETLLRWKFAAGEQWQLTVDQHTVTVTTGAGKPTSIDITMQLRMSWTIDSVDPDGAARMTQRFERFAVKMKSGSAEPIEYASDSETSASGSATDIAAAIGPVIGADFLVTLTERGAIREVKLSDAATEAFTSVQSPALKQLFSAAGISQLLRQTAVEFPEQAVATESSWAAESTTPSPWGVVKQARSYTVAAQEVIDGKTLERINVAGELEIASDEQAPRKMQLIEHDFTGTLYFDAEAGRLAKSESTQKLTTERPYRELKIKVETTATTETTLSSR